MDELSELALKYGTDKGPAQGHHNYTAFYHNLFSPIRADVKRMLEIGVYQGSSVRMWRDYFPAADIVGLDYAVEVTPAALSNLAREPHIFIEIGNQHDPDCMAWLSGKSFDIVIDDASHRPEDYLYSFQQLWPVTTRYYVIEDIRDEFRGTTEDAIRASGVLGLTWVASACPGAWMVVVSRAE